MKEWLKAVINAGIMGGITFCSVVVTDGGSITGQSLQTAAVAFGLTFLTLCSKFFKPPEGDVDDEDKDEHTVTEKSCAGKGLLGCLWV